MSLNTTLNFTDISYYIPNNTTIYELPSFTQYNKIENYIDDGAFYPGKGYFIYCEHSFSIPVNGTIFENKVPQLIKSDFQGFSLMKDDNINLQDINAHVSSNTVIWDFPFKRYLKLGLFIDEGYLEKGKGYLIQTKKEITL